MTRPYIKRNFNSEKRLAQDRKLRFANYERDLTLYHDSKTGLSIYDLQTKYPNKEGKPMSATNVHLTINKVKNWIEQGIHINPAGKLSVGEIEVLLDGKKIE